MRAAVPPDILHILQVGIFKYVIEELFEEKKLLKDKRRKRINDTGEESVYDSNKDTTGKSEIFFVFTKKYMKYFDNLAAGYGRFLSHQCEKNLPRTYFPDGICNNARKTGN